MESYLSEFLCPLPVCPSMSSIRSMSLNAFSMFGPISKSGFFSSADFSSFDGSSFAVSSFTGFSSVLAGCSSCFCSTASSTSTCATPSRSFLEILLPSFKEKLFRPEVCSFSGCFSGCFSGFFSSLTSGCFSSTSAWGILSRSSIFSLPRTGL